MDEPTPIAADLLRRMCLGSVPIDPTGIRLVNKVVQGELELSGGRVPFPLAFDNCRFEKPISLDGAEIHSLTIRKSTLPGLLANGIKVRRDLDLSGSRISGAHPSSASTTRNAAIWLCESEIGGRLLCVDTTIDAGNQRAIQADRMRVGGTVRLIHDFVARGEVRLLGARIGGSLDLTGARLEQPRGLALDIADTDIGGSVHLISSRTDGKVLVRGRIDAGDARIKGRLVVRDATLIHAHGASGDPYWRRRQEHIALSAPRLHVGGEVGFEGACVVTGGIDLSSGELGDLVVETDCRLSAPGQAALDFTSARLTAGLALEPGVEVDGSLLLGSAHVAGSLRLKGTTWRNPRQWRAISARGVRIDGDLELQGMRTHDGMVRFRGAVIGRTIDARGAELRNQHWESLNLQQAVVRGSVWLADGFVSEGYLTLNRVTIEGRLELRDGRFSCAAPSEHNQGGHAIQAVSATVRGGMFLGWAAVTPGVDFTAAATTILADDPANWPEHFTISGFTYEGFAERTSPVAWDWRQRRAWLERQRPFAMAPYEQLAQVFRLHGYRTEAEHILIAQRRRIALMPPIQPVTPWRAVLRRSRYPIGRSLGHGYRPWRVAWMLAGLILLVLLTVHIPPLRNTLRASDQQGDVFSSSGLLIAAQPTAKTIPRDQCGDGQVRCFDSFFFAVDTVVPLISLEQRVTWYPDPGVPWGRFMDIWLNTATIIGWALSSVFVLSFTRFVRSG